MPGIGGVGGLLTTEVERVDLGEHDGRRLAGRVQRRTLRLGFGHGAGFVVVLGRLRPVAVEVEEAGARYEVPIRTGPDPRTRALLGLAVLWVALHLLVTGVRLARRRRRDERDTL